MRRFNQGVGIVIAFAALVMLFSSCSDVKKDLPTAVSLQFQVHPAGWGTPSAANFHGKILKAGSYDATNCQSCHSKQYTGGVSEVSCFGCHTSYPHRPQWANPTDSTYHGAYLKTMGWNLSQCTSCHGTNFAGGSSGQSCYGCHPSYPHGTDWKDPLSSGSHGKYVKASNWQLSGCAACHGSSFTGGSSQKSCYTCHAQYPHPSSYDSGHPAALMANGYPLAQCQACHGSSYAGGSVVDVSCMTSGCHVDATNAPKSPEACNTCHGNFSAPASNFLSAAPPRSLHGDTLATVPAVGAHQTHLLQTVNAPAVQCSACHTVPTSVYAAGHLGPDLRAEVVFDNSLAALVTGNGTYVPNPTYSFSSNQCNNTYCHGNWRADSASSPYAGFYTSSFMSGLNYSPQWTRGAADAACGTCHGLPPSGHPANLGVSCFSCHYNSSTINKQLHMNGKISLVGFGQPERDF